MLRNPLEIIEHAHLTQAELCDALERIADGLPYTDGRAVADGHPLDAYLETIRRLNRHFSGDPLLRPIYPEADHRKLACRSWTS